MKSTFINRDGSPFQIDPFTLGDGEQWNRTIVAPSGMGMSLHLCQLSEYRIEGSHTCNVYDLSLIHI